MAEIVLVHGIDQQQKSADQLESEWLPALAGGVRVAEFPDVADRIWRDAGKPGKIETRMAFYGNLFLVPGQQGNALTEFTQDQKEFAEALALEWLKHAAERATRENTRLCAVRELAFVTNQMGEEQGVRRHVRSAINSLAKIPGVAPCGMGFAERFINRALAQVTTYFTSGKIRTSAIESVLNLTGPETKVLIGHSLGSVIAYEVAHLMKQPLPLLLTLGSPLGLQNLIYHKLRPQPPGFPPMVHRWVNVVDKDDFIATEPDLNNLFSAGKPGDAVFEGCYTVDNGADPHNVNSYLGKVQVGCLVGEIFNSSIVAH